jgi:hypothetical protein
MLLSAMVSCQNSTSPRVANPPVAPKAPAEPTPAPAPVPAPLEVEKPTSPNPMAETEKPLTHTILNEDEIELARLVNEYRVQNHLKPVPISPSLTTVAQTHVLDLNANYSPEQNSTCNMHSWSNKGPWRPCCYDSQHTQAKCMWEKPRELTSYKSEGFEIAFWGGGTLSNRESAFAPASALEGWKKTQAITQSFSI